jgi:hypothetical protein
MLFSFHRVRLAPRVGVLAVLAVAAVGWVWLEWSQLQYPDPPEWIHQSKTELTGGEIVPSAPDCSFYTQISRGHALLVIGPNGTARARFSQDLFSGTVVGRSLDLHMEKTWGSVNSGDHCKWIAYQSITGSLDDDTLQFHYRDEPLPGQTGCYFGCTGTADVTLR